MARKVQFRRSCIFCRSPSNKMSKEHIFGRWLREQLRVRYRFTRHAVSVNDEAPRRGRLHRPGDPLSQTLPVVCEPCNNGWMSELQDKAKPLLLPLMRDEWLDAVSAEELATLAAHAVMTAMVIETAQTDFQISTDAERRSLVDTKAPPEGWSVWFGRYGGDESRWGGPNHLSWAVIAADENDVPIPGAEIQSEQVIAWRIGKLFIQTRLKRLPCEAAHEVAQRFGLALVHPTSVAHNPALMRPADALGDVEADAIGAALHLGQHELRRQWETPV